MEDNPIEAPKCDPTTKHLAGPKPAGMSQSAFIDCDPKTGNWFWNDPQVAPPQ